MASVLVAAFVVFLIAYRAEFWNGSSSKERATASAFVLSAYFLQMVGEHVMHSRVKITYIDGLLSGMLSENAF